MFYWDFGAWLIKPLQNAQPPSAFKFKNPVCLRTKLGCLRETERALSGSPSIASPILELSPKGWLCDSTVISSAPHGKHGNLCFTCADHIVSMRISMPGHSRECEKGEKILEAKEPKSNEGISFAEKTRWAWQSHTGHWALPTGTHKTQTRKQHTAWNAYMCCSIGQKELTY